MVLFGPSHFSAHTYMHAYVHTYIHSKGKLVGTLSSAGNMNTVCTLITDDQDLPLAQRERENILVETA